jgi:hypothetical protein
MAATLRRLLSDPALRASLGRYGRDVVDDRFSLPRAIDRQLTLYRDAMRLPVTRNPREASRVAAKALELEWHNHDPRRKRARAQEARARYEAAQKLVESPT